jgi:hypothetical protein
MPDFAASPRPSTTAAGMTAAIHGRGEVQQPEPLLSLLTSQHPLLSTAINGSLSAYTSSKSYSTRFRAGAEFVERNIASPVASTVGTAGRISGVETGVRWWLQRRDSSGTEGNDHKRRRIDGHDMDLETGSDLPPAQRSRAASDIYSTECLPAYDDQRSPRYEVQPPSPQNWQTRLMMSTSGLGVAMSEESLRSLKYCLSWLRWANGHLGKVLLSLQTVLEELEQSQRLRPQDHAGERRRPRDQATIAKHLQALKGECVQTLKNVIDIVSKYAGGALPENARVLVRRHLTSLPQRFHIAASTEPAPTPASAATATHHMYDAEKQAPPETVRGAQRVVVLAKEGLDMMAQVSSVVNGTIVSAEEWCDRLGRKRVRADGETDRLADGAAEKRVRDGDDRMPMDEPDRVAAAKGGGVGRGEKEALAAAVGDMDMERSAAETV